MLRLIGCVWFACLMELGAQTPPTQSKQPTHFSPQDLARGKQLFEAQCALCHGTQGTGGKGANLVTPTLNHAADDEALFAVIQDGIPNTEMAGTWQMTDREIWLVAAYVRSLGRIDVIKLPGDASRGRQIYAAQGCNSCHVIAGSGGNLGPELTSVGARRSAQRLRQCLLTPQGALPESFTLVRAVREDGSAIEGLRVNEDSFTIQIRDFANQYQSLRKGQLKSLAYEAGKTPMPSYSDRLSPADLDDLVVYLSSLRGHS